VGRLAPVKRPEHFLALVDALPEHVIGVVIGEGPLSGTVRAGAGPRVRFLGATQAPERWMCALDLLVLTSVREGFPLAGVEALAAGVPVLGYDVPGVRDLVGGIDSTLLVPAAGGVDALARRVLELLETGLPTVPRSAAELVDRCDPARVARTLATAYRAALSEPVQ
jgi:glycosyltransferase involved in cell wall biosynthesis